MDGTDRGFMNHGGQVRAYREAFGPAEGEWIDFSANINPLGPPAGVREAVIRALGEIRYYPDPRQEEFRARLAGFWEVAPESVIAGNGAAELIFLLMRVWKPRRLLTVAPAFGEYEEAASAEGAAVERIVLDPRRGFAVDADRLAEALRRRTADLLVLANPNNPTGRLVDPSGLEHVLDEAERLGVRVMLDEAFLDFCPGERRLTRISRAARSEGLFVLRSMTKFYSLPGLRLGYGVASPGIVRAMDRLRPPWAVNGPALAAGMAALEEESFRLETRGWLAGARERFRRRLEALGFETIPSEANFLLVRRDDFDIARVWPRLAGRGLFVRDCRSFGLDRRYFRVAVLPAREQDRLLEALAEESVNLL